MPTVWKRKLTIKDWNAFRWKDLPESTEADGWRGCWVGPVFKSMNPPLGMGAPEDYDRIGVVKEVRQAFGQWPPDPEYPIGLFLERFNRAAIDLGYMEDI